MDTKNKNIFLMMIEIINQHHKTNLDATVNHFSTTERIPA
jgi:hypothetical protein